MTNEQFREDMNRRLIHRQLCMILSTRRAWWHVTGDREAARRVTQELFDLAFKPPPLVETQQQRESAR